MLRPIDCAWLIPVVKCFPCFHLCLHLCSKLVRKNVMENIVPIVIDLKHLVSSSEYWSMWITSSGNCPVCLYSMELGNLPLNCASLLNLCVQLLLFSSITSFLVKALNKSGVRWVSPKTHKSVVLSCLRCLVHHNLALEKLSRNYILVLTLNRAAYNLWHLHAVDAIPELSTYPFNFTRENMVMFAFDLMCVLVVGAEEVSTVAQCHAVLVWVDEGLSERSPRWALRADCCWHFAPAARFLHWPSAIFCYSWRCLYSLLHCNSNIVNACTCMFSEEKAT